MTRALRRWKLRGASRAALGSSSALHGEAQLRDKQRAFELFLDFLRAHRLWRRLAAPVGLSPVANFVV